jgi:hypothetical protein
MNRRTRWLDKSGAWVPHRLELFRSPAWRQSPVPLRRLLERLEVEHMRHGGQLNGQLFVSYNQFEEANISRRKITATLKLGEALGLIRIVRPTEPSGDLRAPHSYRLTYLPAKGELQPTDEWKCITTERAEALIEAFHATERAEVKSRTKAA